jgi:hypothetical protein
MDTMRARRRSIERHASRLAHEAIRNAGTLRAVGDALGQGRVHLPRPTGSASEGGLCEKASERMMADVEAMGNGESA